jgi:hypothetical protein
MYLSINLWLPSQIKIKCSTMFHLITSSGQGNKNKKGEYSFIISTQNIFIQRKIYGLCSMCHDIKIIIEKKKANVQGIK